MISVHCIIFCWNIREQKNLSLHASISVPQNLFVSWDINWHSVGKEKIILLLLLCLCPKQMLLQLNLTARLLRFFFLIDASNLYGSLRMESRFHYNNSLLKE